LKVESTEIETRIFTTTTKLYKYRSLIVSQIMKIELFQHFAVI